MKLFVLFLIILNPFSQALFLRELFDRLTLWEFAKVHLRATVYSFIILGAFAVAGEPLLNTVFQVRLGSLRVFGGLITLLIAYRFIAEGEGSNLLFRGHVADLAPNITLPYMVGAGGLWVSILMGEQYGVLTAWAMVAGVLLINSAFVLICHVMFGATGRRVNTAFTKYFAMLMRVMALFVGAIGVEMIFGGAMELLR